MRSRLSGPAVRAAAVDVPGRPFGRPAVGLDASHQPQPSRIPAEVLDPGEQHVRRALRLHRGDTVHLRSLAAERPDVSRPPPPPQGHRASRARRRAEAASSRPAPRPGRCERRRSGLHAGVESSDSSGATQRRETKRRARRVPPAAAPDADRPATSRGNRHRGRAGGTARPHRHPRRRTPATPLAGGVEAVADSRRLGTPGTLALAGHGGTVPNPARPAGMPRAPDRA